MYDNNRSRDARDHDPRDMRDSGSRKRMRLLDPNEVVDLNNPEWLRRFITDYGKIVPARLTGVTAAQQRQIKKGIRRARNIGLLP